MLVPITSSLYVPGETSKLDTVLIDVGTGYYIEKSGPEAQAFLDRKIHLITGQAVKVAQAMQIKQDARWYQADSGKGNLTNDALARELYLDVMSG